MKGGAEHKGGGTRGYSGWDFRGLGGYWVSKGALEGCVL